MVRPRTFQLLGGHGGQPGTLILKRRLDGVAMRERELGFFYIDITPEGGEKSRLIHPHRRINDKPPPWGPPTSPPPISDARAILASAIDYPYPGILRTDGVGGKRRFKRKPFVSTLLGRNSVRDSAAWSKSQPLAPRHGQIRVTKNIPPRRPLRNVSFCR